MDLRHTTAITLLLAACQEPFGTDRHDLVSDRIAAVPTAPVGSGVQVRPLLVIDGELYADIAPDIAWYALPDDAQDLSGLDPSADPLSTTWVATLPVDGPAAFGLIVVFPSGAERRAILRLPEGLPEAMPPPTTLDLGAIDLDFDEATEEQLAQPARASLDPEPVDGLAPGRWGRLEARWVSGAPATLDRVRWMCTAAKSTFLELDTTTTDWATGEVVLDDLEIEQATPLSPGVRTVVALALDGRGANSLRARDVVVGDAPPSVQVAGRRLGIAEAAVTGASGGLVSGRLEADDALPSGLRLEDAAATPPPDPTAPDPWGTRALPCQVAVDGPFDPGWLLDGSCLRSDVLGHVVVVDATGSP